MISAKAVRRFIMSEKYMDKNLPIHERVEDLMSQMTLDEKIGQLHQEQLTASRFPEVTELAEKGLVSSCILAFSRWAGNEEQEKFQIAELNKVQRTAMEKSRLHIPKSTDVILFTVPLQNSRFPLHLHLPGTRK
jgi:beta-glucosidase